MAGGTFIKIAAGAGGAAAANVDYITRERAVKDREDGVLLQNMPEEVEQARGRYFPPEKYCTGSACAIKKRLSRYLKRRFRR